MTTTDGKKFYDRDKRVVCTPEDEEHGSDAICIGTFAESSSSPREPAGLCAAHQRPTPGG